jgi:selenide,water dikinase
LNQAELGQVLRQLPQLKSSALLIGSATSDDAAVYRLSANQALVQTVDFFTPIVDDPFTYGQIAATNSLSDVYAMGGRPLTAMNILGVPNDKLSTETIREILRGGATKVKEAGCLMVGGHSIRNPEPIYGLSVTGMVHPRKIISNAGAKPGDLLVLTKPLGTGIVSTAIKRGTCPPDVARAAIRCMTHLNRAGADLAEQGLVRGGTDVTGFGVLGHLGSLCKASKVGAELAAENFPPLHPQVFQLLNDGAFPGGSQANLKSAEEFTKWNDTPEIYRKFLADAQTSGGLLLCISPRNLGRALKTLARSAVLTAAIVGRIRKGKGINVWRRLEQLA